MGIDALKQEGILFSDICSIIDNTRNHVATSVNRPSL